MHVPDLTYSEDKMREGREVAIALIKALVESKRKRGVRHVGGGGSGVVDGVEGNKTDNNFA
jgi:hypothetical protein